MLQNNIFILNYICLYLQKLQNRRKMEHKNILEFLPKFRELFSLTQNDIANEINEIFSLSEEKSCTQSYINKIEKGANITNPKIEAYLINKLYYIDLDNYKDIRDFAQNVSKNLEGSTSFSLSYLLSLKNKTEIVNYLVNEIENNNSIDTNSSTCKAFLNLLKESICGINTIDVKERINPTENLSESVDIICNGNKILNINNLAYFVLFIAYFHIHYLVTNNKKKPFYKFQIGDIGITDIDIMYENSTKERAFALLFEKVTLLHDWSNKTRATKGKLCATINFRLRFFNVIFNEFQDYHSFIPKLLKATTEDINDEKLLLLANCLEDVCCSLESNKELTYENIESLLTQLGNNNYSYSNIIPYIFYIYQNLLQYNPNINTIKLIELNFKEKKWFSEIPFINSTKLSEEITKEISYIEKCINNNDENILDLMSRVYYLRKIYNNLNIILSE